jgi:dTDP-4-dehydrorhamnose reductase
MWLLIGGDSEIGAGALAHMRTAGREFVATTRRAAAASGRIRLDLSEPLDHWEPPPRTTAVCIFAAAARLAACAADPDTTSRVNVTATVTLTERLIAGGIYVLLLSTNQVFDGRSPHVPADAPTAPASEYGRQKARTEAALRGHMARGAPVGILRLAKVISPQTVLLRDWRAALVAGRRIRAFHDMTMAPAPIETVSRAVEALLDDRAAGVYQLTGPRDLPYSEAGYMLAARLNAHRSQVEIVSVASAGLPQGVAPPNTTLDSHALRQRYGIGVPDGREVLETTFAQMD